MTKNQILLLSASMPIAGFAIPYLRKESNKHSLAIIGAILGFGVGAVMLAYITPSDATPGVSPAPAVAYTNADGPGPIYNGSDYAGMIDTIMSGFNGCTIDTSGLFYVMKNYMRSQQDVVGLINAFGAQDVEPCVSDISAGSGGTFGWLAYELGDKSVNSLTLPQAIAYAEAQLNDNTITSQINTILAGNSVAYQF